jgi:hypothetical protein
LFSLHHLTDINKVTVNGCRRRHRRADQMGAPTKALPALKVTVAG